MIDFALPLPMRNRYGLALRCRRQRALAALAKTGLFKVERRRGRRQRHRQHEVVMLTLAEAGIDKKLSSRAQKLATARRVVRGRHP